jgi:ubiquinone/menaquinone biosynthesis C-methylase UbiE
MQRVLEPEVMDTLQEAVDYDAMDFTEVNTAFALQAVELGSDASEFVLDAGTGTARIPIIICQMQCSRREWPLRSHWQVTAIDLAENMLQLGRKNIEAAGLEKQIKLEIVDTKQLPYADGYFDMVMSNALVHHLPDPLPFFLEIKRVVKPKGAVFVRDLIRPVDEVTMNAIVDRIGTEYNEHQKMLFRDSLYAAFTLDEVKALIEKSGLEGIKVYQSSDLHWTAERKYL